MLSFPLLTADDIDNSRLQYLPIYSLLFCFFVWVVWVVWVVWDKYVCLEMHTALAYIVLAVLPYDSSKCERFQSHVRIFQELTHNDVLANASKHYMM